MGRGRIAWEIDRERTPGGEHGHTGTARTVADYADRHDPTREAGRIAELNEPVGSILCVDAGESVAKLRLLWVDPSARGHGVGVNQIWDLPLRDNSA